MDATQTSVHIKVELFGAARLKAGVKELALSLPTPATASQLADALARSCPALLGDIVRPDRSGLVESYTLNLNGLRFITSEPVSLRSGDKLLLFSSQAGG